MVQVPFIPEEVQRIGLNHEEKENKQRPVQYSLQWIVQVKYSDRIYLVECASLTEHAQEKGRYPQVEGEVLGAWTSGP